MRFRGVRPWAAAGVVVLVALIPAVLVRGRGTAPGGGPASPQVVSVTATADTTVSQVVADGDGRSAPTLSTCPADCGRAAPGGREAVLRFEVPAGPAGATVTAARLELHCRAAVAASVAVYPVAGGADSPGRWSDRPARGARLATRTDLTAGRNDWDVTAAVHGAGPVSLALAQSAGRTRVRWASREEPDAGLRPRLVITWSPGPSRPA